MPIYEFVCKSCGHEFEELVQSAAAVKKLTCPSCQAKDLTQKLSVFGVGAGQSHSSGPANCSTCPAGDGSCPYSPN